MSVSRNDITGDTMITRGSTDAYRSGWDLIYGNKTKKEEKPVEEVKKQEKKKEKKD